MKASDGDAPPAEPGRLRLSSLVGLYLVRHRRRWPQELLAIVGIAAGVALLFASQVASTSLSGPVQQLANGIVGNSQLQLVGRGPGGLPAGIADDVRALPGVQLAAPILQVQANVVGPRGGRGVTIFGADPRVVELRGSLLQGFSASEAVTQRTLVLPEPVARSIGVHFGDNVTLQVNGKSVRAPVATVGRDAIGDLSGTAIAMAPIPYLQDLAGLPDRITRVVVQADPARVATVRDRLDRLAAGRFDVRPADYESTLFDVAAAPTSQATLISSVLSAMVGFLFAFGAMLVTVGSRRALALDLRMNGFPPWQVVRILLFDAFVLGTLAVALGLVAGDLLSRHGYGSNVDFLGGAFPLGDVRVVTASSYAVAIVGGLLAAVVGVLAPLGSVLFARTPRREASLVPLPRRRVRMAAPVGGAGLLAAAVAITAAAPGAALVGLIALTVALVLLLPAMLALSLRGLTWLSRRRDDRAIVSIELALPQLRGREWRARALAIVLTGAVAVFGSVALQGARGNLQSGLDQVSFQLDDVADVWVSPPGAGSLFGTTPFAPVSTRKLERVPGVRAVGLYRAGLLDVADRRILVLGSPTRGRNPVPPTQILRGDLQTATSRIRSGGWITVSRALADDLHLEIGMTYLLPAPRPTPLRVAAITTNLGWSGGAMIINADDYARAWGSTAIGAYLVKLQSGVSPRQGVERVEAAIGRNSALHVEDVTERHDRAKAFSRGGLNRLSQIASLTLVAAMIAMAAAMAGLLWQRRITVARQKLNGFETMQMWRTLAVESGVLFTTGCLAGALFGLLGQVLFSRGLEVISGFPVNVSVRAEVALLSFALVVGIALLMVALPGYLVARVRPSLRTGD